VKSVRADIDSSALEAVHQWTYKPFLLNGDPIAVDTTITVTYSFAK
jgi:outer membrane biosynthesis protein TonB